MTSVPKWFRVLLLILTAVAWIVFVYLSSHISEDPIFLQRYSGGYLVVLLVILVLSLIMTVANSGVFSGRLYSKRKEIFLLVGSILFLACTVEMVIRVVDPLGVSYYAEATRVHLVKIPDAELVYKLPPLLRGAFHGVDVRLNELGLRDEPVLPKAPGEYRIVILGDSIVFGTGVAQDQIFSPRLQKLLSQKMGRPVRVINTGVPSYNTVQEYTFLQKTGLSLKPDLVVLVYVDNDVELREGLFDPGSELSLVGKSPPRTVELIVGKSWTYRLMRHAMKYSSSQDNKMESYDSLKRTQGWAASMEALRNISNICELHNIPLVVVFYRWKVSPVTKPLLDDVRKHTEPHPVVDAEEWFLGKELNKFVNSRVDAHPNSEGHRIISEKMAETLGRFHVLPRE